MLFFHHIILSALKKRLLSKLKLLIGIIHLSQKSSPQCYMTFIFLDLSFFIIWHAKKSDHLKY